MTATMHNSHSFILEDLHDAIHICYYFTFILKHQEKRL